MEIKNLSNEELESKLDILASIVKPLLLTMTLADASTLFQTFSCKLFAETLYNLMTIHNFNIKDISRIIKKINNKQEKLVMQCLTARINYDKTK